MKNLLVLVCLGFLALVGCEPEKTGITAKSPVEHRLHKHEAFSFNDVEGVPITHRHESHHDIDVPDNISHGPRYWEHYHYVESTGVYDDHSHSYTGTLSDDGDSTHEHKSCVFTGDCTTPEETVPSPIEEGPPRTFDIPTFEPQSATEYSILNNGNSFEYILPIEHIELVTATYVDTYSMEYGPCDFAGKPYTSENHEKLYVSVTGCSNTISDGIIKVKLEYKDDDGNIQDTQYSLTVLFSHLNGLSLMENILIPTLHVTAGEEVIEDNFYNADLILYPPTAKIKPNLTGLNGLNIERFRCSDPGSGYNQLYCTFKVTGTVSTLPEPAPSSLKVTFTPEDSRLSTAEMSIPIKLLKYR